ncbi:MAG TPA: aldo/keto reductase [Armatimonadota bacterium]|jgi:predicted aldo/keto reductase-like oxidoreductase
MSDNQQNNPEPRPLNRREFVQRLAIATAGVGFVGVAFKGAILNGNQRQEVAEAAADKIGKLPKRNLGKRLGNMKVAPMFICQDWNKDLYAAGLAAGLNFVHKAGYWREMPEEFKKLPRESYYTDVCVDSTPNNPDDETAAYRQVTESLDRNGLKYYDIFRAHFGWKTADALKNQRGTYRAFQRLKKEGKVRYFGVSQHDYRPYPEIIQAIIDDGTVDHMQVFFSYGEDKAVNEIFDKAHRAGIGLTAMKVFARGFDRVRDNAEAQAALKVNGKPGRALYRHVLNLKGSDGKPIFDACVSNLRNFDQFDENIGAASSQVAMLENWTV